jgi:5'-methylthioadenosine nucleosidase
MSAIIGEVVTGAKRIEHIVILIAMVAEAEPFVTKMKLNLVPSSFTGSPCLIHTGEHNGSKISVVTNGKDRKFGVDNVGTVPAALATFLAINQLHPDLVISAGTAGGFRRKGAAIGDPFICTSVRNHDRRIPIPGYAEYGLGDRSTLPCPKLVEVVFIDLLF